MSQNDGTARIWLQTAVLALAAAVLQQVVHESTHGFVALAVGMHWDLLNLFAVDANWPGAPDPIGQAWVSGSAAIVDILIGICGLVLLRTQAVIERPRVRLALFYYTAFSWLAGFGYLFIDAIFYNPEANNLGDWRKVIGFLGGSWRVRLPILFTGLAGTLYSYFWMPPMAVRFGTGEVDRESRVRIVLPVLLVPYFVVNITLTTLAIWHPLGAAGTVISAMKTWMGNSPFLWGFFIAGYWTSYKDGLRGISTLPSEVSWPWIVAPLAFVVVVVALLLPTVQF